jgi:hypothetical protein
MSLVLVVYLIYLAQPLQMETNLHYQLFQVFVYICQFEYNFVKQDLITQALLCMHSLICGAMYTQHLLLFPI